MRFDRVEMWIAKHTIRLFLAFAVVALVGGYFVTQALQRGEEAVQRLKVLEPQVTKIVTLCEPGPAISREAAHHCAEHFRVGLTICRRFPDCRAAWLALRRPPEGVMQQTPSHQGQEPGRGEPGHHHGGQEMAPTPSPSPSPGPEAPKLPDGKPLPSVGPPGSPPGLQICAATICVEGEIK